MEEFEEIVIVNDEGEEFSFAVDRLFELNGKRYAVLIPLEDLDEDDEDDEADEEADDEGDAEADEESAVIFRVEKDEKGEDVMVDIDDDQEFSAVEEQYYHLCEEDEAE